MIVRNGDGDLLGGNVLKELQMLVRDEDVYLQNRKMARMLASNRGSATVEELTEADVTHSDLREAVFAFWNTFDSQSDLFMWITKHLSKKLSTDFDVNGFRARWAEVRDLADEVCLFVCHIWDGWLWMCVSVEAVLCG